jgi:hypothetical protein
MSQNTVSKKETANPLTLMGAWSFIGIVILLFVITLAGGVSYGNLLSNIGEFVIGNLSGVVQGSEESMISVILNTVALILITLVAVILALAIFNRGTKSYESDMVDALLDKGPLKIFSVILVEELFTRGLFLGLGTMLFRGDIAFYILFILGNSIWALIHLVNYSDKNERSLFRVIPQFVCGIGFTYIYIRYGLGTVIMAHFIYDVILFATRKKKIPDRTTWFSLAYYGSACGILFIITTVSGISLNDVAPWINNNLVPLNSFSFLQYAAILVLIDSIITVLANILLLDTTDIKRETLKNMNNVFQLLPASLIYVVIILGGNWLMSLIVQDIVTRVMTLTIILSLLNTTTSGSALARTTLVNLPSVYFTVVAFSVLGFWPAFGFTLIFLLVDYIPRYINYKQLYPQPKEKIISLQSQ